MSCFGDKIKCCRTALGITQEQLAQRVGTTKQVISHYESGVRTPKIDVIERYASNLNVPVDFLIKDSIAFRVWEFPDQIEDYWRASAPDRLHLVVKWGIDPRIAADYKNISTIEEFVANHDTGFTQEEQELIKCYRRATEKERENVFYILREYRTTPSASGGSAG